MPITFSIGHNKCLLSTIDGDLTRKGFPSKLSWQINDNGDIYRRRDDNSIVELKYIIAARIIVHDNIRWKELLNPDLYTVSHLNGDKLDNRRANLVIEKRENDEDKHRKEQEQAINLCFGEGESEQVECGQLAA